MRINTGTPLHTFIEPLLLREFPSAVLSTVAVVVLD